MSNYSQTTFFTPKDSLPTTNPAKTIYGAAYDVEFGNIATAIATKYDSSTTAITLTGQLQAATVIATSSATIGSPTSGAALTVTGNTTDPTSTGTSLIALQTSGAYGGGIQIVDGTYNWTLWDTSGTLNIGSGTSLGNSTKRITIAPGGNLTINTPSSGTALTVSGSTAINNSSGTGLTVAGNTVIIGNTSTTSSLNVTGANGYPAVNITAGAGSTGAVGLVINTSTVTLAPGIQIQIGGVTAGIGIQFVNGPTGYAFTFGTGWSATGAATPTLSANKPGSNSGVNGWLQCQNSSGNTVYIPFWT